MKGARPFEGMHFLVTGVTGLIGGELALTLLKKHSALVSCLVRPSAHETIVERLDKRFRRSGEELNVAERERVSAVQGDVTQANLGIAADTLGFLQRSTDVIIHSAAETSFIRSQNCRDINIDGTRRVIELARSCERKPLLIYISTACNVGDVSGDCIAEEAGCRPTNRHHNEYTHSKAIAETMLRESGLPILIIRPSIVLSAGIHDPEFARQILWVAPLFKEFDCLPINPEAKIDIVPVSYVVDATLRLAALPERRHACYHLSAGADYAMEMGELTTLFSRHYGKNPPMHGIPRDEWGRDQRREFVQTPEQRKLFFALRYYLPFLNMDVVFDNSRLKREADVEELGLVCPTEYLHQLLDMVTLEDAVKESHNP